MEEIKNGIGIIAIGQVPDVVPKIMAAHIGSFFQSAVSILEAIPMPVDAYNVHRRQYDAALILKVMADRFHAPIHKVIGVCDQDIFVPIFTHVLGEARQGGRYAVVSLFRLHNSLPADTPIESLYKRCVKVAIHEMGHLFDLRHCEDDRCLMHFSGSPLTLDRLPIQFCRYCYADFHSRRLL